MSDGRQFSGLSRAVAARAVVGAVQVCCAVGGAAAGAGPAEGNGGTSPGVEAAAALRPVISEVLFAVPRDDADANGDGRRHSAGDEFVEVWNPWDEPVELTGYTVASRLAAGVKDPARGFHFTFPECTLGPGEVAVVFNGFGWRPRGPVGSGGRAPGEGHPEFAGAWVFNAAMSSPNHVFANGGDFVLLTDPEGRALEAVIWGSPDPEPPGETLRVERVSANPRGSVQLLRPGGPFEPHVRIDDATFSPGRAPEREEVTP